MGLSILKENMEIVLVISAAVAILGIILELSTRIRSRNLIDDTDKRPPFFHRNLRLVGRFKYKNGLIRYHCFCLGPFIFAPMGCYMCSNDNRKDVRSSQRWEITEVIALYLRWGWVSFSVSLLCLLFNS